MGKRHPMALRERAVALVEDGHPHTAAARQLRVSITFDRGFEFVAWKHLKRGMGTEAWFCDPQAPWQKGSVESFNRRARSRYLPRDTQLMALSNRSMMAICERLNGTPRKCLGYRTPAEAFREELRQLK